MLLLRTEMYCYVGYYTSISIIVICGCMWWRLKVVVTVAGRDLLLDHEVEFCTIGGWFVPRWRWELVRMVENFVEENNSKCRIIKIQNYLTDNKLPFESFDLLLIGWGLFGDRIDRWITMDDLVFVGCSLAPSEWEGRRHFLTRLTDVWAWETWCLSANSIESGATLMTA